MSIAIKLLRPILGVALMYAFVIAVFAAESGACIALHSVKACGGY